MVLLLETATVLEARARRAGAAQGAVLMRRAAQRREEAARLREQLADRGAALGARRLQRPEKARPVEGCATSGCRTPQPVAESQG